MLQKEMMNRELPEVLIKKWKMDSFSERYFCNSWALYAWLLHNLHLKSGVASSYIRYHEPRVAGRKPFSVGGSVSRNRPYI